MKPEKTLSVIAGVIIILLALAAALPYYWIPSMPSRAELNFSLYSIGLPQIARHNPGGIIVATPAVRGDYRLTVSIVGGGCEKLNYTLYVNGELIGEASGSIEVDVHLDLPILAVYLDGLEPSKCRADDAYVNILFERIG